MSSSSKEPGPAPGETELETVVATAGEDGERLDRLLAARLPHLSRSRIASLIRGGHVAGAAGTIREPSRRVKPGERFHLALPPPAAAEPAAEAIPLAIAYEDDAVIVVDKPAGLVVHPAPGHAGGTLVNALLAHCGDSLSGIGGVKRPGIVHRLDKDTSGLLVVAKTDAAHRALAEQFADHGRTGQMAREYLAFVWSAPPRTSGIIDRPLGRHPTDRQRQAIRESGGRKAVTRYEVVETYGAGDKGAPLASLVRCRLETGRTHQIRVHMAAIRCPLIGDETYGKSFRSKAFRLPDEVRERVGALGRQALHAALLAFAHPTDGRIMRFESPLPDDLAELRAALRKV